MNPVAQSVRRILVIANRTCPCPTLADEVARRASAAPTDVLVVAPALNSRLRHWLSDVDEAAAANTWLPPGACRTTGAPPFVGPTRAVEHRDRGRRGR